MVKSEQSKELGPKWFTQLRDEVGAAEDMEDFRAAINPDAMGFDGQEGVDDDNQ